MPPAAGRPPPPGETSAAVLLAWVWRSYVCHRLWLIAAAVVLMVVEGAMMGILAGTMEPMFDRVFIARDQAALGWVALMISGSFIVRAVAQVVQRVLIVTAAERSTLAMQTEVLGHLVRLDKRFHIANAPGMLIERVRGDSAAIGTILNGVLVPLVRDSVALVSLLTVAVLVDWRWTLVALVGAPLLAGPIAWLQRRVRGMSRAARVVAGLASTRLDEIFHGLTTIQMAGTEPREVGRYTQTVRGLIRLNVRVAAASGSIPAMMDIVAALGFAAVLAVGAAEIGAGQRTVGEFMAFFTAMALVFEPMRRLGAISGTLQVGLASLERVRMLLDEPVRVTAPPVVTARAEPGPILFDDVTFAYHEAPVLDRLTLRAEPGQRTALVGRSGAGKTTVFTLLTRQADPQAGRITLNGTDIRSLDLADLRRQFSVVAQETALFDETLRDNILLGRTDVSPAALEAALEAARVTEFLPRLAQGLDTPVGPRGSALSGGQRQRVAIARALVRDAPILLLDEATSALDSTNEALVQEALERLSVGRTVLVIAHRLTTVQDADRILVMDAGRVVETGTHRALQAAQGLYADLCRMQLVA